ncbi:MAG: hypothetical protein GY866_01895, partial [Proteobacteria bacterium]|nr:hypothetical protein [Pseudomonadota bacterium]
GRTLDKKTAELIETGNAEIDPVKRQQIYRSFEKAVYDDYQDAWLWYPQWVFAYSKNAAGYNNKYYRMGLDAFIKTHPQWLKNGGKK